MVALLEKEFRHPLAELLYKEALNRSEVQGTNFNYILMEKPALDKDGITGNITSKANKQILSIKIGNCKLLEKNHIEVPKFQTSSDAATCIYLSVNDSACMVRTSLCRLHCSIRTLTFDQKRLRWSSSFKGWESKCISSPVTPLKVLKSSACYSTSLSNVSIPNRALL